MGGIDIYGLKLASKKVQEIQAALDAIDAATAAIKAITPNLANLDLVAENVGDININATNITNINTLATIIDAINSLVSDKATLDSLYADKAKLDDIFADLNAININATNITNINALAAIIDGINSLVSDKATLDSLYTDKATLDSLYADKNVLDTLYADKATLDSLFADKATLDALFADKDALDSLYADKTKLDAIFTDLDAININATNITDIQNAYTNAQNAKLQAWIAQAESLTADSYANQAEDVFVDVYTSNGDGTFTATPTTEYSAYHWKQKAQAISNGSIDGLSDVDTTGKVDKSSLIFDTASGEWIATVLDKSSIGLDKVDNTSDINKPISSAQQIALQAKSNIADIQDILTSTDTTKPLSANQGKVLKGLIDNITTLLSSSDTALDTLQEIVDFVTLNRSELDALGISNIAGLQSALDSKLGITATAVNSAKWNGSTQYTSTAAASGGVDGDIWFQY
ncbi:MAG: hypothetical protein R3331_09340 [Sulfurospirillaceae bacterium]|nr:hypothetical protein [Sulfurospirillaceae bacterium]